MMDRPIRTRRGVFMAEVSVNVRLCEDHYRLGLRIERFPPTRPGQFVQLQCRHPTPQVSAREVDWPADRPPRLRQPELTDREPLLRRPFSLAGRRDGPDGVELDILYRVVGTGTGWLAGVSPGEPLSVLGPLGNSFRISEQTPAAALVGGGVGIPPLVYLAAELAKAGKRAIAFCGIRRAGLLPLTLVPGATADPTGRPTFCVAEFAAGAVPSAIATEDGSLGARGMVSDVFSRWMEAEGLGPRDVAVCACGPEAMMQAVGKTCVARDIECQVAMERHMACGMGTCQSCIVKIRDDSERGWSYKLCCTDGPVFDARDVVWG